MYWKNDNGMSTSTRELITLVFLAFCAIILLFMAGCDKNANIVQHGDSNNQTLLISHNPNSKAEFQNNAIDWDRNFTFLFQKNGNAQIDLSYRIRGNHYLDFGSVQLGGITLPRFHTYQVVEVPDSNGIPAHQDTIDVTYYMYYGALNHVSPLAFDAVNSDHVFNISTEINLGTPISITNIAENAAFSVTSDMVIELNQEIGDNSYIYLAPTNPNYNDSTTAGHIYTAFIPTSNSSQIVIPKEELQLLKNKWVGQSIQFTLSVSTLYETDEFHAVDKRDGTNYEISVAVFTDDFKQIYLTD